MEKLSVKFSSRKEQEATEGLEVLEAGVLWRWAGGGVSEARQFLRMAEILRF